MCNNVSQSCNFIQAVDKIISTFHWQEQSSVLYISIEFFMYFFHCIFTHFLTECVGRVTPGTGCSMKHVPHIY